MRNRRLTRNDDSWQIIPARPCLQQQMLMGGGGGISGWFTDNLGSFTITNLGGDAYALVKTDGTLDLVGASTTTYNWYSPTTAGIGTSPVNLYINWTFSSGAGLDAGQDWTDAVGGYGLLSQNYTTGFYGPYLTGRTTTYIGRIYLQNLTTVKSTFQVTFVN